MWEATLAQARELVEWAQAELDQLEEGAENEDAPMLDDTEAHRRYITLLNQLSHASRHDPSARATLDQLSALRRDRGGIYLIDAPERHLHPALERQAMTWLKALGARSGAQVVIATHSPHLLRVNDASFVRLTRDLESSHDLLVELYRPDPINPAELDALDGFAGEMGFDRGELLTSVEVVLFVEGVSDQILLQTLFGAELHHAGVILVPIQGASRAKRKGLVDGELVMRYTTARLALLLDNVTEETCHRIRDDERERTRLAKEGSTEEQAMAQTFEAAYRNHRDILPLGLPCRDAFDLLDEDILIKRYPRFPGHASARERHPAEVPWKDGYSRDYGIAVGPDLFREVVPAMAERGVTPQALEQVVASVTELAARSGG